MLEGGEEPDNVTKTGADGGVPAPRETTRRIPQEVDAHDGGVNHGPRRYDPKGRRSGGGQVRATAGRPRGGGSDREPWSCSLKGRRNGGARVGAAAGTASGGDGDSVPRSLRPYPLHAILGTLSLPLPSAAASPLKSVPPALFSAPSRCRSATWHAAVRQPPPAPPPSAYCAAPRVPSASPRPCAAARPASTQIGPWEAHLGLSSPSFSQDLLPSPSNPRPRRHTSPPPTAGERSRRRRTPAPDASRPEPPSPSSLSPVTNRPVGLFLRRELPPPVTGDPRRRQERVTRGRIRPNPPVSGHPAVLEHPHRSSTATSHAAGPASARRGRRPGRPIALVGPARPPRPSNRPVSPPTGLGPCFGFVPGL
ncbi:proline-rich receptor-like protein kinase PERK9 [Triticum urartu]|uniref:proline-rich receptor-like protein kinase PERK9 n=1 Tax=Triticum urartu TaxID=4572 RepID=UPI002043820C|nr:proline-rich receptor-like protein kinase PERK9 [Triticum urartu]